MSAFYIQYMRGPSAPKVLCIIDELVYIYMCASLYIQYMRGPSAPKVLCIIGSGVQARSHVEALRVICDFKEVSPEK